MGRRRGSRRIEREEEGAAGVGQDLARARSRDCEAGGGGAIVMDDERVDGLTGETGQGGRKGFARVGGRARRGICGVFGGVRERAEAGAGDVGHQRVAHVRGHDLDGEVLAEGPRHDADRGGGRGAAAADHLRAHEGRLRGGVADTEVVTAGGVGGEAEGTGHRGDGREVPAFESSGHQRGLGVGTASGETGEVVRAGAEDEAADGLIGAGVLIRAQGESAQLRLSAEGAVGGIKDDRRVVGKTVPGTRGSIIVEEDSASAVDDEGSGAEASAARKLEEAGVHGHRAGEVEAGGVEVEVVHPDLVQRTGSREDGREGGRSRLVDAEHRAGKNLDDAVVGLGGDTAAAQGADGGTGDHAEAGGLVRAEGHRTRGLAGQLQDARLQVDRRSETLAGEAEDTVACLGQRLPEAEGGSDLERTRAILDDHDLAGGGTQQATDDTGIASGHAIGDEQAAAVQDERGLVREVQTGAGSGVEAEAAQSRASSDAGETGGGVGDVRAHSPSGRVVGRRDRASDDVTGAVVGGEAGCTGDVAHGQEGRGAEQSVCGVSRRSGEGGTGQEIEARDTLGGGARQSAEGEGDRLARTRGER